MKLTSSVICCCCWSGSCMWCWTKASRDRWIQWVWTRGLSWWLVPYASSVPWEIQAFKHTVYYYWKWGRWRNWLNQKAIYTGALTRYLWCHDYGSYCDFSLCIFQFEFFQFFIILTISQSHLPFIFVMQGIPIIGYFFWTISDNWEWADGYGPKFGLVSVDRANNLARVPRPSYHLFSKVTMLLLSVLLPFCFGTSSCLALFNSQVPFDAHVNCRSQLQE